MNSKLTQTLGVATLTTTALTGTAQGQSNESILEALVRKGVLTEEEADAARQDALGKKPDWTEKLTLQGDLRLRYEQKHQSWDEREILARQRQRYRFRLGGIADLQNGAKLGFRFATGSTDNPISTNQTMDDAGHNDALNIDQAYVAWSGGGWTLYGGKMPAHDKTGWMINKGFLDSDYTPEGVEVHYDFGNGYATHFSWNALHESSSTTDMDALVMAQVTGEVGDLDFGLGTIWIYNDNQLTSDTVGSSGGISHKDAAGNSESGDNILSDFNPWFVDAKYKLTDKVGLRGTYINNPSAHDSAEDSGYSLGIKYGKADSMEPGTWEVGYEWRHMERDVMWHQLTHSDFGAFGSRGKSGQYKFYNGTNVEGSVIGAKYQWTRSTTLGFKWYITDAIDSATSGDTDTAHRMQFDLVFKF